MSERLVWNEAGMREWAHSASISHAKEILEKHGMKQTSLNSKACDETIRILLEEAGLVQIVREEVQRLARVNDEMVKEMKSVSSVIKDVSDAQKDYGTVTDERAKNALALYCSIVSASCALKKDNNPFRDALDFNEIVKSAGYITYAYLGGQARRIFEDGGVPNG